MQRTGSAQDIAPFTLDQRYLALCKKAGIDPLDSLCRHVRDKLELRLEFDFLPKEHYDMLVAALKQQSSGQLTSRERGTRTKTKKRENGLSHSECPLVECSHESNLRRIRLSWKGTRNAVGFIEQHSKRIDRSSLVGREALVNSRSIARETLALIQQRRRGHPHRQNVGTRKSSGLLQMPLDYSSEVQFMKLIAPCIGPHLTVLEITGVRLSIHSVDVLATAIKTRAKMALTHLLLRGTELGDSGLAALVNGGLRDCHDLESLTLADCDLTDDVSPLLCGMVRLNQEKATMRQWVEGLREGSGKRAPSSSCSPAEKSLRSLDLSWNFLTERTVVPLARALQGDESVQSINLSNNIVGYSGLTAIENTTQVNQSLCYIDLSGNVGVQSFFERGERMHFIQGFGPEGCVFVREGEAIGGGGCSRRRRRRKKKKGGTQSKRGKNRERLPQNVCPNLLESSISSTSYAMSDLTSVLASVEEDEEEEIDDCNEEGERSREEEAENDLNTSDFLLNTKPSGVATVVPSYEDTTMTQEKIIALLEKSVHHLHEVVHNLEEKKMMKLANGCQGHSARTSTRIDLHREDPSQVIDTHVAAAPVSAIPMNSKQKIRQRLQEIWAEHSEK